MRTGTKTLRDALTERGKDFAEWLPEMAATNQALDDAGIVLDSDPRKRSKNGQAISTGGSPDGGNEG